MEKFRANFLSFSFAGPGTNNPNMPLVLASASFDSTSQALECGEVNFFLFLGRTWDE